MKPKDQRMGLTMQMSQVSLMQSSAAAGSMPPRTVMGLIAAATLAQLTIMPSSPYQVRRLI